MTKRAEIAKDKAMSEILTAVAEQNTLDVLGAKTIDICNKYFPNADEVTKNCFIDFAYSAQAVNFARKVIHSEINRYEREQRTASAKAV